MTTTGETRSTARAVTAPWGMSCLAGALLSIASGIVRMISPVQPGEPRFAVFALLLGAGALLLVAGPVGLQLAGAVGRRAGPWTAAGVLGGIGIMLGNVISWVVGRDTPSFYIVGTVLLFVWAVAAAVLALRTRTWAWPWRGVPLLIVVMMLVTVPFFGMVGPIADVMLSVMMVSFAVLGVALLRDRTAS